SLESIPFDLASLVFDVVELQRPKTASGAVELLVDIDEDGPARFIGDPSRLRQVLGNLISNAIKFTTAGHVLVKTRFLGGFRGKAAFQIAVSDTGIGISPEAQQRLFQAFSQADASTSRRYGGSGLGLVLCKRIVEGMAGRIELSSAAGKGSTFTVSLELPEDHQQPRAAPEPAILRGARVLVLDDNEANLSILRGQLSRLGVAVESATTGPEALDKLRAATLTNHHFSAAVVDHHLPGASGEQVGRMLRADPLLARLGLLMLTSSGVQGDAAVMESAGFDAFLVKPARSETLTTVLSLLLERRQQGEAGPLITRHTAREVSPPLGVKAVLTARLRVLLAEDNLVNQRVAEKILEGMGATTTVAGDGFGVLAALERSTFDVVLMDCQMPGMDGFAATAAIRERERLQGGRIPIIAVTANAVSGDREHCLGIGMDDYISKPITRQGLWNVLSRWTTPVLDGPVFEEMKEMFAQQGDFYSTLLAPFLSITAGHLRDLARAAEIGDGSAAAVLAHKIKGSSLSIGFAGLGGHAGDLETRAKLGQLGGAKALVASLQDEFRRLSVFIEQFSKKA
ncbi:MAG TPA: response regulator, partial [Myxococcales bacterium]|nr:response regulator [Myxococcales bacterium]